MVLQKHVVVAILTSLPVTAWAGTPRWAPAGDTIRTPWAKDVNPSSVWPEYPRPMMVRKAWLNLNGLWDYALTVTNATEPNSFDGQILVPFAVESALSGVGKAVAPDKALWYRKAFQIPTAWKGKRVLLHFGAVDWDTTVTVNGQRIGSHRGGYDPFSFDITDALTRKGPQQVTIRVWDPTDQDNATQPRGKQVLHPSGIFYTAVTGIWQTVWLEPVPQAYIDCLKIIPDVDGQTVTVTTNVIGAAEGHRVVVEVREGLVSKVHQSALGQAATLRIKRPRLWSPQKPFLYDLRVTLRDARSRRVDSVVSYFGMRKISVAEDPDGINRLVLNNEPLFQFGPLDQGWWPDGLYTAPTDKALRYDLEMTKALGFNMLRKHVKVEPQRLYTWADRMGLLIWQDMPSSLYDRQKVDPNRLAEADKQWELELRSLIDTLQNHPSIVMWVPFNEGWGQHDTRRIATWVKGYDPTRLVNNASGWTDEGAGDVRDIHVYPGPDAPKPERRRAVVLGEFGGLGLPVKGHLWKEEGNWGYRSFDDFEAYHRQYTDLISALYGLKRKGLSAAVYTQTTDCESEVNGLMTYDRRICKLDPQVFVRLNQGFLPPEIEGDRQEFIDSMRIELLTTDPYVQVRYTLDGSEPTRQSPVYSSSITIGQDTTLKARSFRPDGSASVTATRRFKKARSVMAPVEPNAVQPGLVFEYFEGLWSKLPDFPTLSSVKTGVAKTLSLDGVTDAKSRFGLRFTGYLRVPKTDVYAFTVTSDDGARLRLGDQEVVIHDGVHGMTEAKGEIALEAGWHPIELVYFQGEGGLGLQVSYECPGMTKRPIPAESLGH